MAEINRDTCNPTGQRDDLWADSAETVADLICKRWLQKPDRDQHKSTMSFSPHALSVLSFAHLVSCALRTQRPVLYARSVLCSTHGASCALRTECTVLYAPSVLCSTH